MPTVLKSIEFEREWRPEDKIFGTVFESEQEKWKRVKAMGKRCESSFKWILVKYRNLQLLHLQEICTCSVVLCRLRDGGQLLDVLWSVKNLKGKRLMPALQ